MSPSQHLGAPARPVRSDQFTFIAPTVSSVSPASGPTLGGTSVVITGADFTGATAVTFGGTPATGFAVVSDTSITATTPAHSTGAVNVTVTNPDGSGTSKRCVHLFCGPDRRQRQSELRADGGRHLRDHHGYQLHRGDGGNVRRHSGDRCDGGQVPTTITATVPANAVGTVDVAVTTPGGTGTATGAFTYVPAPTVTSVSPSSGPTAGGTFVTITGTNFTGVTAVTFGGIRGHGVTVVVSATTITATTPAHAVGAVDVAVTTPGGTGTGTGAFTYVAGPPTVTGVSPSSGRSGGGTSVTITGTNFTGATAVTFGGAVPTGVTVVSATSITATTPAHALGVVDVR